METGAGTNVRTDDPSKRFSVGDRVEWNGRKRGRVVGRVNMATVLVEWDDAAFAEVSPAPAWDDRLKRLPSSDLDDFDAMFAVESDDFPDDLPEDTQVCASPFHVKDTDPYLLVNIRLGLTAPWESSDR